ncbi:MAG: DUF835 domain-containing protein [Thermoplasmata archaeon]
MHLSNEGRRFITGMVFVDERKPRLSLSVFLDRMKAGDKGLLIAKNEPDHMCPNEELEGVECHRLLLRETENSVRPSDLAEIETIITSFFNRNKGGVALLDGFEMLTLFNDFSKVADMLNKAQSAADSCGGSIVIPIDNRAIYPEDYRMISENYRLLSADDAEDL